MLEYIYWIFLTLLSIYLLQWIWKNKILLQFLWKVPGLSLWFMLKKYGTLTKNTSTLHFIKQCVRIHKTPFWMWFGGQIYVTVTDPKCLQILLNSPHCINRGFLYNFLKGFNGNSLLTLNMPEWKRHRKILNPAFNSKILQSFVPIFNEEINVFITKLESFSNTDIPNDIAKLTYNLTLEAVARTVLGKSWNSQKADIFEYHMYMKKYYKAIARRYVNPLYYFDSIYRLSNVYKAEKKASTYLMNFTKEILQEKRDNYVKDSKIYEDIKSKSDDDIGTKTPYTFIDQLMKFRMIDQVFNNDEITGELNIIIPASYETTGLTIAYSILMMAIFQNHQETIYEEVISIMPKGFNYVEYEDLSKFTFLDRFIKETLRLCPSVPYFARSLSEDIKIGKYTYPAGIDVTVPIIELHRNKEIWGEDAENFNPDHFLPENIEKIHPYAYMPFSAGPRNCIGMKYAQILIKITLIRIISIYKFRTDLKLSDLKFRLGISLLLINKHMVYVEKRNG